MFISRGLLRQLEVVVQQEADTREVVLSHIIHHTIYDAIPFTIESTFGYCEYSIVLYSIV